MKNVDTGFTGKNNNMRVTKVNVIHPIISFQISQVVERALVPNLGGFII